VIDVLFFFIELIAGELISNLIIGDKLNSIGYAVGSLALVADSFHMLKLAPPTYAAFIHLTPVTVM
jgi:Co/Zn/Cd efflux system component